MDKRNYLIFVFIFFILAATISLGYLFIDRSQVSADQNSAYSFGQEKVAGTSTTNLCQVDSDCNDGIDFTKDICMSAKTSNAMCIHKANRPISACSSFPSGSNSLYGYYNGNFDQKNLLDSIDVITDLPSSTLTRTGNTNNDTKVLTNSDVQKKGKLVLDHIGRSELAMTCGVSGAWNNDITANQINSCSQSMVNLLSSKYLDKKESDGTHSSHGLNYDELCPNLNQGLDNLYTAMAKAFRSVKQKYPYASIYIWTSCDPVAQGSTFNPEIYANLLKSADYAMPEIYLYDDFTEAQQSNLLSHPMSYWEAFWNKYNFSKNQRNLIMGFDAMVESDVMWTADHSSSVNYYNILDYQLGFYKQQIKNGSADGVISWLCNRGPEEQSVIKQLFDHYIKQNKDNRLFGNSIYNNFITNSSFENTGGWQLSSANGGSLDYYQIGQNSTILNANNNYKPFAINTYGTQRAPEIPKGIDATKSHVLRLKKGQTSNVASQPIQNLVAGKLYKLVVYSKKITGDYSTSGIKTKIQSVNAAGTSFDIDAQYKKVTYYNIANGYGTEAQYQIPLEACARLFKNESTNGTSPIPCNNKNNLWTKEELIFKASTNTSNLRLAITDDKATAGDINVADFVQLQEYHVPAVEIRADKTAASRNDVVNYTIEYHNYSSTNKTNIVFSIPLDSRFEFVSASNGGNKIGNKIQWSVSKIDAGGSLFFTYKVKVK